MKINNKFVPPVMQNANATKTIKSKKVSVINEDKIELKDPTRKTLSLNEITDSIVKKLDDLDSFDNIAKVRQQLQDDSYPIEVSKIAESMLGFSGFIKGDGNE